MNLMKSALSSFAIAILAASPAFALGNHKSGHATDTKASVSAPLTDGEVKKIDKDNGKITIKHGEIKNLDMPGMTMVFKVKDLALLEKLKTGDNATFNAAKIGSSLAVTALEIVE